MEILLRLFAVLQNLLCTLLEPIYWINTLMSTTVPLPTIRNPILTLSATQLAEKIRTGELKCEEVMEVYSFRSRRIDMKLNAIVDNRYDLALREAEQVDELIESGTKSAEELEKEKPLLGVPISISECCKVKGLSHSSGCTLRAGKKADSDGAAVTLLRNAGAIPIVVTNQPELCVSTETNNLVSGLTKNPYDFHRTVGGSAGGEASLIGGAGSVAGIGSDWLGSVRCPAMFTGIFGHRPTPGIVSVEGHYPEVSSKEIADTLVLGPLTRFAEDLPVLMRILAGDRAGDLKLDEQVNITDIKVFYMTEAGGALGLPSVHKEIKRAIVKAVDHLESQCNCNVQKVSINEMSNCLEISRAVLYNASNLPDLFDENESANSKDKVSSTKLLKEMVKSFAALSRFSLAALQYNVMKNARGFISSEKIPHYLCEKEILRKKLVETLGVNGILVLPTHPSAAHYHHQFLLRTTGVSYCAIITALGLPATNVPMGLNRSGLPIGIQVVAAPNQDRLCFAVAQELEKAFGGWVEPPSLKTPSESRTG